MFPCARFAGKPMSCPKSVKNSWKEGCARSANPSGPSAQRPKHEKIRPLERVAAPRLPSALVEDEHSVIGHPITRFQIAMRVIEGFDLDDVRLAYLVDEVRHHLVEMVLAHLHAI